MKILRDLNLKESGFEVTLPYSKQTYANVASELEALGYRRCINSIGIFKLGSQDVQVKQSNMNVVVRVV
jgi:hypothetical protein